MIPPVQSSPHFLAVGRFDLRRSQISPLHSEAINEPKVVVIYRSGGSPTETDTKSPERSTLNRVTFDEHGRALFQIVDAVTQEVERQYPEQAILKIREYVAALDCSRVDASKPYLSVTL